MQTFLPFPDATRSAQALDDRRLGNQTWEGLQIVQAILDPTRGYQHHPAVNMWRGHVGALGWYITEMGTECQRRGLSRQYDIETWLLLYRTGNLTPLTLPWWWGDAQFHLAHQSALIRKVPTFYGPQFPHAPLDRPYLWPTDEETFRLSKPDVKRLAEGELYPWPPR